MINSVKIILHTAPIAPNKGIKIKNKQIENKLDVIKTVVYIFFLFESRSNWLAGIFKQVRIGIMEDSFSRWLRFELFPVFLKKFIIVLLFRKISKLVIEISNKKGR